MTKKKTKDTNLIATLRVIDKMNDWRLPVFWKNSRNEFLSMIVTTDEWNVTTIRYSKGRYTGNAHFIYAEDTLLTVAHRARQAMLRNKEFSEYLENESAATKPMPTIGKVTILPSKSLSYYVYGTSKRKTRKESFAYCITSFGRVFKHRKLMNRRLHS